MIDKATKPPAPDAAASQAQTTGSGSVGGQQMPSVGRIVHVRDWSKGQAEHDVAAAIVTKVESPTTVSVTVFPDQGPPYWQHGLELDEPGKLTAGKWQWPTRY